MSDPYQTLGVARDADDGAIHAAYLARVKETPPERDAARFQAMRAAYEAIRSRRDRIAYDLFDTTPPTAAELLDRLAPLTSRQGPPRATREQIVALLKGGE